MSWDQEGCSLKQTGGAGEGDGEEEPSKGTEWWDHNSLVSPHLRSFYKVERPRNEFCSLQQIRQMFRDFKTVVLLHRKEWWWVSLWHLLLIAELASTCLNTILLNVQKSALIGLSKSTAKVSSHFSRWATGGFGGLGLDSRAWRKMEQSPFFSNWKWRWPWLPLQEEELLGWGEARAVACMTLPAKRGAGRCQRSLNRADGI